jgi:hypothetical protein
LFADSIEPVQHHLVWAGLLNGFDEGDRASAEVVTDGGRGLEPESSGSARTLPIEATSENGQLFLFGEFAEDKFFD